VIVSVGGSGEAGIVEVPGGIDGEGMVVGAASGGFFPQLAMTMISSTSIRASFFIGWIVLLL
jgi:hypothetical protein